MRIVEHGAAPRAALPGIEHTTLAGRDAGLAHLSVWRQSIAPDGATPLHFHDCEEVVLIERGSGEVRLADRVVPFGQGATLVIGPGELHQIVNTDRCDLETVGIFAATPVGVFAPGGAAIDLPWPS